MRQEYEIRDPVYGFIAFNDWEKEILNHPVFQRLRRIKQLALTEMVYPGAVHTRFEHSLVFSFQNNIAIFNTLQSI